MIKKQRKTYPHYKFPPDYLPTLVEESRRGPLASADYPDLDEYLAALCARARTLSHEALRKIMLRPD